MPVRTRVILREYTARLRRRQAYASIAAETLKRGKTRLSIVKGALLCNVVRPLTDKASSIDPQGDSAK
jgi:hypothetical protein